MNARSTFENPSTGELVFYRKSALILLCAALLPALSHGADAAQPAPIETANPGDASAVHNSIDRSGVLRTQNGLKLRLITDLGTVHITSLEAGAPPVVRYSVHIETDAGASVAQRLLEHYSLTTKTTAAGIEITGTLPPQASRGAADAQFWVQFDVAVPATYSVDVGTDAGDITTQDIGGTASLVTQGGNIRTGRIGFGGLRSVGVGRPVAKLSTEGGHIQVQDVAGDITAFTGGGHINAGDIAGDAILRSAGGHIVVGKIGGQAELDTDGGNITVGQASSLVKVHTGGGQIDFGEVRGSVRAKTGGGGIRIMYVSGPMEVESSSGSICLTRVAGAVRAATAGGTITAWINPDTPSTGGTVHLSGDSQLASGAGDVIVFLPRNLAANIEAIVENGGKHHIEADPSLPLTFQTTSNQAMGPVQANGVLNGGGALLKLRTTAGRIRLQLLGTDTGLRESLIREQKERIRQRMPDFSMKQVSSIEPGPPLDEPPQEEEKSDWLDSWMDRMEIAFLGGLREDPVDFQKRLSYSPRPPYPELARRAGIQGIVRLQVRVTRDGRVEVMKLLGGEPVLADAAIETVKRWRARPAWINGKQVEITSTVTFNFQLP